jgi:predicted TIM-barrel fold metal-dependent hydrolase
MIKFWIIAFVVLLSHGAIAGDQLPIIDIHLHSYPADANYGAEDFYGNRGPSDQEAHFRETYERLRKYNIVRAVVSGVMPNRLESMNQWMSWDSDHRLIPGLGMPYPGSDGITPERFELLVRSGKVKIFGEIGPYYSGTKLSDPEWQPYLAICEKYDIPVSVHTGGGEPGGTYSYAPNARLELGDPYLIEDTLVRYPKLRLYIAHAGEEWHEHALRLMAYYPNLYTDISVLLWVEPNDQRYARVFLRNAKDAGYLDRVMYGSDQMLWPDAIDRSLEYLESLEFLTDQDKRNILYNNAARFLQLHRD